MQIIIIICIFHIFQAKFGSDNILQFHSCSSNRYLRALPNGGVDAAGVPTAVDSKFKLINNQKMKVCTSNMFDCR